jgi:hypothetical protein
MGDFGVSGRCYRSFRSSELLGRDVCDVVSDFNVHGTVHR